MKTTRDWTLERWRSETAHAHPLVKSLYDIVIQQQLSLTELARRSGVSVNVLINWRTKSNPNVASLEAALNTVGYRLAVLPMQEDRHTTGPAA